MADDPGGILRGLPDRHGGRRLGLVADRLESRAPVGAPYAHRHSSAVAACGGRADDDLSLVRNQHHVDSGGDCPGLVDVGQMGSAPPCHAARRNPARLLPVESRAQSIVSARPPGSLSATRLVRKWSAYPSGHAIASVSGADHHRADSAPRAGVDLALLRFHPDLARQPLLTYVSGRPLADGRFPVES